MTVYGICEKGKYRRENQDAILARNRGRSGLCIVADGVGGSADGLTASRYIVEQYGKWWENTFLQALGESFFFLFESIKLTAERINGDICRQYGAGNCCSTLVLLFIHKGVFGYLSCGDSRIYRCGRSGAKLITRDDIWENQPDVDIHSQHMGKIISAVGGYEKLEYSCATDRAHFGEVFMLCSDGIYKFVEEEILSDRLRAIYRSFVLRKEMAEEIAGKAVENDTRDNYSLVIVKV